MSDPSDGAAGRSAGGPGATGLDEAAERLRHVESILEELAEESDVTEDGARRLRALRDAVSVHLSAASSLRLVDLDDKAAAVLCRAVDSVRSSLAGFEHPANHRSFCDAG